MQDLAHSGTLNFLGVHAPRPSNVLHQQKMKTQGLHKKVKFFPGTPITPYAWHQHNKYSLFVHSQMISVLRKKITIKRPCAVIIQYNTI